MKLIFLPKEIRRFWLKCEKEKSIYQNRLDILERKGTNAILITFAKGGIYKDVDDYKKDLENCIASLNEMQKEILKE